MNIPSTSSPGAVALVTGGARGIGYACAQRMVASGAAVSIWDMDPAKAEESRAALAADGTVSAQVLDLSDELAVADATAKTLAAHGKVDILVNNAGITGPRRTVKQTELADWERVLSVNLTASMLAIRALAPLMPRGGSIVNIASTVGMTGYYSAAYSCSKWALRGLTRAAALELAPRGIRVNCVEPGYVDTAIHDGFTGPAEAAAYLATTPARRAGTTDECVGAFLFLASRRTGGFVTGQVIAVNGGAAMF